MKLIFVWPFLMAGLLLPCVGMTKDGPGMIARDYAFSDLFVPLGHIKSSEPGVRGHAALQMVKGYAMGVESKDSGLGKGALAFFDLSDPSRPVRVATHADVHTDVLFEGHNYGFAEIAGRDIVFLNAQKGIQIWDMSNIHKPLHLSSLDIPGLSGGSYSNTGWWLALQYPFVYLGATNAGIHIIDASDLEHPRLVNTVSMGGVGGFKVGSLFACGNLLFANSFDGPGISSFDIRDPRNPRLLQTLPETFGYSMLFNGGYLYGIDDRPQIWDVRDPENMKRISPPHVPVFGGKGGYGVFQDGFLHQGMSGGYAKIDVRDPENPRVVKVLTHHVPNSDYDGANVMGNLVVMTCDHGTGSLIFPHTEQADTRGPEVNFISPAHLSRNNARTSRIGMSFTDEVDHRGLERILVQPVGGSPLKGQWSLHNAILNFAPDELLEPDTTYEVVLPKGAVRDQVGNRMSKETRFVFSTGSGISHFPLQVTSAGAARVGEAVRFDALEPEPGTEYAWDFGDGSRLTPYTPAPMRTHTFSRPGRYPVVLHARRGSRKASAVTFQVVYAPRTASAPRSSTTLELAGNRLWNVNPDNDSVTISRKRPLQVIKELPLPAHPRSLSVGEQTVAVVSEDAAVLTLIDRNSLTIRATISLPSGSQPYGVVLSQDDGTAYVSSQALGEIYVIACGAGSIQKTIRTGDGHSLRGLALDAEERHLYATRFLSPDHQGEVYRVDLETGEVSVIPLAIDTSADTEASGRGLPNVLSQIRISPDGTQAWVPAKKDNIQRGVYRDGQPLTFENTVRPIACKIDLADGQEVVAQRHDFDDKEGPVCAVYSSRGDLVFVALQGANSVEVLNAYTGTHVTSILNVGAAPQGLAVDEEDGTLYVYAFLDRAVSRIDIREILERGDGMAYPLETVRTVSKDKLAPEVLKGKKIFYHAGDSRMSRDAYLSCASCHLDGRHDGRTWDFTDRGEGLRNTISLLGRGGESHGPLHWTANFDEVQDFEHDMREAFGGFGFLEGEVPGFLHPLGFPKAGLSEELDALASYVQSLTRVPDSPYRPGAELSAAAQRGKEIFERVECAACHSGDEFTDSPRKVVHQVGTVTTATGKRRGGELPGLDTPTLKGVWATAPYLHDGSAKTLMEVLTTRNPHEQHGNTGDLTAQELEDLVAYLQEIDEREPAPAPVSPQDDLPSTRLYSHREMVQTLIDARKTKTPVAPITSLRKPLISMTEAYEIQKVYDRHVSRGYRNPAGYKMAYASRASQKKWGIGEPVSGTFYSPHKVQSGGEVKLSSFVGFHIETEVAFVLAKAIKEPIQDVEDLDPYIASVHVGLDVPDLLYDKSKGPVQVADVIAMSCGTHTYVLGEGVPLETVDFQSMHLELHLDGTKVYSGKATEVLGDPRESLRQLANRMIEVGTPLKRKRFVLTGAVAGAYFPKEGEPAKGTYTGTATGMPPVTLIVK